MAGKLTISIDLELAWGFWDILTPEIVRLAETAERPICDKLIELFDRYHIPVTWAVVAAVLDHASAQDRPGNEASWCAPEIIDRIRAAKTSHEIGSHGGRHLYYDRMTAAEAEADIAFIKQVHRDNGLSLDSFVFPRNAMGHLDLLAQAGLRTFRGTDTGWVRLAPKLGSRAGKILTFADKILPLPPTPARAEKNGGLVDIPGSMLLPGRDGVRRFIFPAVSRAKLAMGLAWARRSRQTFHFWFHPCNFYYRADEQFATLDWFLRRAAEEASRGRIEICTMRSYAPRANDNAGAKAAA
jgi:peptidoglycan/xylan/chitin deacetylase (PgdA/CDA1 family)